nr:hypothetical protein GTC16762_31360 [Pigmentibacter ruber]
MVIASSNYIRHKDEWVEKSNKKDSKIRNIEKYNVDTLEKSGLIHPREGKYSSLDLVKHLKIERWETLFQNISNWLNDCLPNHPGFRQNDIVLPEN